MLEKLLEALRATGIPFEEYAWAVAPATDYGVFSPEGSPQAMWSDNRQSAQAIEGTIDLFCRSASREAMRRVQEALRGMDGVAWKLNSTQFEEQTRMVHYEWVFRVIEWAGERDGEDAGDGA